jgi:hypothetical protein
LAVGTTELEDAEATLDAELADELLAVCVGAVVGGAAVGAGAGAQAMAITASATSAMKTNNLDFMFSSCSKDFSPSDS